MPSVKAIRRCAICLRIFMFLMNSLVWVGALVAIVCGLMIGFSNGTFSLDAEESDEYEGGEVRWMDALYTTPATLLIYYGVIMLFTAIVGCFAGAGGMKFCNFTFVVLIILAMTFDAVFGYLFYWNPNAMENFMDGLDKSMDNYGVKDRKGFGIIPFNATKYWDYLQRVGSCCGIFEAVEWMNKSIGTETYSFSLPDSCCTRDYDYRQCGWRIWKHMEGDMEHYRYQMLKTGCITIFPEEITTKYHEIAYITISLGVVMVICLICAIVLLALMFTKKYKAGYGPEEQPHFVRRGAVRPTTADVADENVNNTSVQEAENRRNSGVREEMSPNALPLGRNQRRVSPIDDEPQAHEKTNFRSIQRKPSASTENIFMNKKFGSGAGSDYEELPVIYKEEAETRLRRIQYTHERPRTQ